MRISKRLMVGSPCFSFEFFPPKTPAGEESLLSTLRDLAPLSPDFVSVTYGAGGSTRGVTADLVAKIKHEIGIEAMAHLTCLGHTRDELGSILDRLQALGIENVLALRGDLPRGDGGAQDESSFRFASELVQFVAQGQKSGRWSLELGGACYPEGHLESGTREEDLANLVTKVDAGLRFLLTQLFFDNAFYFDFLARAKAAHIQVPIVPGIMPITNFEQVDRFTRLCGATIPMKLRLQLERYQSDAEAILELGVAHATVQCVELLSRGAPGIHFYTLNKSRATRMILSALRAAGW